MKLIDILCKKCKCFVRSEHRLVVVKSPIVGKTLCNQCRESIHCLNNEKNRQRMLVNNPVYNKEIADKISRTLKRKYETGEISSIFQDPQKLKEIHAKRRPISCVGREIIRSRMVKNNPMFNEKVRKKVSDTIHKKIDSGQIVYKRGHLHPLYKGNRTFSNECRKWLKYWIKSVMERDKYSCTVCGINGGYLHTHHIRPLRDIINLVLTRENVNDIVSLKSENILRYEQLIKMVVGEHKTEDGMTVCKQCHANIDDRYRRIKKSV